jgi:hypothetical protein
MGTHAQVGGPRDGEWHAVKMTATMPGINRAEPPKPGFK